MGLTRYCASIVAVLVGLSGCSSNTESSKRRLIETGNKYYNQGKLKEANLIYRTVIQKDPKYGEAYYRLGLTELKAGRIGPALQALRRASELQPDNEDAHARLGDLYLTIYLSDSKRFTTMRREAEELADKLLKRNPRHYVGLRIRGYLALGEGNFASALQSLRLAAEVRPDQPDITLALAQCLLNLGQKAEAEQLVRRGIERQKDFGQFYEFLYAVRMSEKNLAEAEKIRQLKVDNNPKSPQPLMQLASHYLRTGNNPLMRQTLERITSKPDQFPNGHEQVGEFLYLIGELAEAQKEFEAGIKASPGSSLGLRKKLVEIVALQGRVGEAVAMAEALAKEKPGDAEVQAIRATLRLRSGKGEDVEKAVQELQGVLAKLPENPNVRFNLGEALMAKGDLTAARVQFEEALKLRPGHIPPRIELSRLYHRMGDYSKSRQLAEEVIQTNPNLIPPRLLRAQALLAMGDLRAARPELEFLLSKVPDLRDARYMMGQLLISERKWAEAEKEFRRLWEMKPPDSRALFALGDVYANTNREREAMALLDAELAKNPPNSLDIRRAKAVLAVRQKDYPRAIQEFEALLRDNPNAADLWTQLADTYLTAGQAEQAIRAYQKSRELAPSDSGNLIKLGMLYDSLGRTSESRQVYEQILRTRPDHVVALNNLAYQLAESGEDLDRALALAQRAKQQLPTNLDVSDTLGLIYIKKNLSADAIRIFEDLVRQKPDNPVWRYHLGMALFKGGKKLEAKKQLEAALANRPKPSDGEKIRALLSQIG